MSHQEQLNIEVTPFNKILSSNRKLETQKYKKI